MESIIGIICIVALCVLFVVLEYKRTKAFMAKEAAQMEMYQAIKSHLERYE